MGIDIGNCGSLANVLLAASPWSPEKKLLMTTHELSIIASGLAPTADDFEARFYDAGCDDATVSFQHAQIILDFARDAATLEEASASAIEDVRAAGAHVIIANRTILHFCEP